MDDEVRLRRLRRLSPRQREVLALRCQMRSQEEIAEALVVTVSNVKYHMGKIYEHLELDILPPKVRPIELGLYCPLLQQLAAEPRSTREPQPEPEPEPEPIEQPSQRALVAVDEDERALVSTVRPDVVIYQGRVPEPTIDARPRVSRGMAIVLIAGIVVIAALTGALVMALTRDRTPPAPTIVSVVVTATPDLSARQAAPTAPAPPTAPAAVPAPATATALPPTATTAPPTATPVPPSATPQPPTPTPQPPTATPRPQPGAVLYEANWAGGRSGWSAGSDWKFVNGMMVNNAANQWTPGIALAPFQAPGDDYAVEAEIQFVEGQGFGVIGRVDEGATIDLGNGYNAGIYSGDGAVIYKGAGGWTAPLGKRDFDPGKGWHTYRLEVKGNVIRLLIDGALMVQRTDNQFLTGSSAGLWAVYAQINVRSFKIVAL